MEKTNKTAKYIIIALCALVVVLLIAMAFLLGQRSGEKKNAGQDPAAQNSVSVTAQTGESETVSEYPHTSAAVTTAAAAETPAQTEEPQPAPTAVPRNLDISMSAGSLTFVGGDAFGVDYDAKVIRAEFDGDTFEIENLQRHPSASERRRMDVTVTVPDGTVFDSVDIEFGAGKLIVHSLHADTLELELGAGSATLDDLRITGSAEIQEGAGELIVKGGSLNNMTLRCGAGATRVAAALTGVNRIDAAVGAVDLDLDGAATDYTVAFQVGLGACYYNNEKIARSGSFGEGPAAVDINGGFGVMRVNVG